MRRDPVAFVRLCIPTLQPWQEAIVREALRTADGRRVYSNALLEVARGNGKTELAAAIALYLLVGEGRSRAEVFLAAGSRDQATEAYKSVRRMVEASPVLHRHLVVRPGYRTITHKASDSTLKVISAEAPLQHGLRPTAVVLDELWNAKDRDLWDALVGGLVKAEEPYLWVISTPGFDQESLLYELHQKGIAGNDPRLYFNWITAPAEAPVADEETWALANPALGTFLYLDGLRDSFERMHEAEFRRYHLAQWTSVDEQWMTPEVWDACSDPPEIPEGARGVVIGVDVGLHHDSTAVATVWRDEGGTYHARWRIFAPTPTKSVDLSLVIAYLEEERKRYPAPTVCYDEHFFAYPAEVLRANGWRDDSLIVWPQNNAMMAPATQTLYEALVKKKVRHGGDPAARAHALAAGIRETERGIRISKMKGAGPNDGVVALAMAVELIARNPVRRSVYEERGLMLA
jgi:phage terminase large subunit-like protein